MLHSRHLRHPRGDRLERDRPLRHAAPHQGLRQDPSGHLHLGLIARSAQNLVIWDKKNPSFASSDARQLTH